MHPVAFRALIRYLYTERLELPRELAGITFRLAKQCGLSLLHEELQRELNLEKVCFFHPPPLFSFLGN